MAPEVIPFPMQHMSGRDERPALVGDPDRLKSSLSPQDDCPLPTPQRQSVAVTGQAPIAMFENAKNIIINGGQFTQTISMLNSSSSASDTKPQSHNISDLYQRNMASLRAGTALWIPEGHSNSGWFPYRGEGVSIGDVGIVTPSGSFSVLFNICLPAGHPVNRNGVPRGFKSINPAIDPCDIREIHEFMPMDFLSTDSIIKLASGSDDSTPTAPLMSFQAHGGDGAIVVMPEGAVSQDLENMSKFRSYAAANIEDWYHYANVTRGREIANGELRLVIGCDKTTSWAIAAVPRQNQATTLHLRPARDNHRPGRFSQHHDYSWDSSGSGQARVGPRRYRNPKDADNTPQKLNQCLFVRTMNLKLGTSEWCTLAEQVGEARHQQQQQRLHHSLSGKCKLSSSRSKACISSNAHAHCANASSSPSFSTSIPSCVQVASSSSGPRRIISPGLSATETSILNPHLLHNVKEPPAGPLTSFKHPSDLLHNIMLSMYPEAKMAITEDDEFLRDFKLLNPNDPTSTLSHDQLLDRLKELYEIKYDGVVVYLEKKKNLTHPGEDSAKHDDPENPT